MEHSKIIYFTLPLLLLLHICMMCVYITTCRRVSARVHMVHVYMLEGFSPLLSMAGSRDHTQEVRLAQQVPFTH